MSFREANPGPLEERQSPVSGYIDRSGAQTPNFPTISVGKTKKVVKDGNVLLIWWESSQSGGFSLK
jgi:hypothetical protein